MPSRTEGDAAPWMLFLELFALCGITLAQPVFGIFGAAAEEFVIVDASAGVIVAFALIVVIVPPLVVFGCEFLIRTAGAAVQRLRTPGKASEVDGHIEVHGEDEDGEPLVSRVFAFGPAVHAAIVGILIGLFAAEVVNDAASLAIPLVIGVGIIAAIIGAIARFRVTAVGSVLRIMAIGPVLFTLTFLFVSPVAEVAWADGPSGGLEVQPRTDASVLMITLDELPTQSLLGPDGEIDAHLFPNFAALADASTWFRNHSSVAPSTPTAVPALLTGRFPTSTDEVPIADNHPENVFTMLGGTYDLNVWERATKLCPTSLCARPDEDESRSPLAALLAEAVDAWKDFASPAAEDQTVDFKPLQTDSATDDRVDEFIESLNEGDDRLRLDFLHLLAPHQPWWRTADGQRYGASGWGAPLIARGLTGPNYTWTNPAAATSGKERHLLQVRYTDMLLGRILDAVRDAGRFDDTIIVVVADHGVAFTAGQPVRGLGDRSASEVMWTPLFVKDAGQQDSVLDERPAQSTDVVPTLVDMLGIDPGWEFDGTSAFDEPAADPGSEDIRLFTDWRLSARKPTEGIYVRVDGTEGYAGVLAAAPSTPHGDVELRVHKLGPFAELVGGEADLLLVNEPSSLTATLADPQLLANVDLDAERIPVYVEATIDSTSFVDVAFILNGTVAATANGFVDDGSQLITTVLPPSLLREGANDLELAQITNGTGSSQEPRLQPIEISS